MVLVFQLLRLSYEFRGDIPLNLAPKPFSDKWPYTLIPKDHYFQKKININEGKYVITNGSGVQQNKKSSKMTFL